MNKVIHLELAGSVKEVPSIQDLGADEGAGMLDQLSLIDVFKTVRPEEVDILVAMSFVLTSCK